MLLKATCKTFEKLKLPGDPKVSSQRYTEHTVQRVNYIGVFSLSNTHVFLSKNSKNQL